MEVEIGEEAMSISHVESDRVNNKRGDEAMSIIRTLENTDWDLTGVYLIHVDRVCNSLPYGRAIKISCISFFTSIDIKRNYYIYK